MQLGFQAIGFKSDVVESIKSQAAAQIKAFAKVCQDHQVPEMGVGARPHPEGYKLNAEGAILHKACPINNSTSSPLVSAAVNFVNEHLAHVTDESGEVAVSFSMTVSRPNPTV